MSQLLNLSVRHSKNNKKKKRKTLAIHIVQFTNSHLYLAICQLIR